MNKRIIYPNDSGGVVVRVPAPNNAINSITGEWIPLPAKDWESIELPPGFRLCTPEDVAKKDVPEGKPFKIVDVADVPTDRSLRNAWEVDFNV